MRYTEIAIAKPFEGAPVINLPDLFGASVGKELLLKIPVTGERPVEIKAHGLVGTLSCKDGIISGCVEEKGNYKILITAENKLGKCEKELILEIDEAVLLTPLMGFTSWNAFGADVSQEKIERTCEMMVETDYVNTATAM